MRANIVAKRYASAFYSVVKSGGDIESLIKEVELFVDGIKASKELASFVVNPLISKSDKLNVVKSLKSSGKISDLFYRLLSVLVEKNRLYILEDVCLGLKSLYMDEKGEVNAEVKFAFQPDEKLQTAIKNKLSEITGKKIWLDVSVDESVLGGFVAKVQSQQYDASVKGQLDNLRETLIG